MSVTHLVKIGLMAKVGTFVSADSCVYARDAHVICRTDRGLESGVVICDIESDIHSRSGSEEEMELAAKQDGMILRLVTPDDQLILNRLERHRDKAFVACQELLEAKQVDGILMDVEHLFDGESVFFYFLGDVGPQLASVTEELAAIYDRKVRFKKFAETLANGCGPDCGTKEGGCSSGGCSGCAVAKACKVAKVRT
ncbi:MAG: PSP1 C-terminal domain-containing protein [Planctomycetota bacterium]